MAELRPSPTRPRQPSNRGLPFRDRLHDVASFAKGAAGFLMLSAGLLGGFLLLVHALR